MRKTTRIAILLFALAALALLGSFGAARLGAVRREAAARSAAPSPTLIPSPTPTPYDERAEEQRRQEAYSQARAKFCARDFDGAREGFLALGEYEDSARMAALCLSYPESEPQDEFLPPREYWQLGREFPHGTLYWHDAGVFYVPETINSETSFELYYCGGDAGEDYLYYPGVFSYFDEYHPNAVIFFCNESGYWHIQEKNTLMYAHLQRIARELGTAVHDLSTSGSSCGCYTALKAASQFYTDYGQAVTNVCTLDTGLYWVDPDHNLTDEECDALFEAGTVLYLFEEPDVGVEVPQLKRFVDHGIETWSIACKNDQHSLISVYAYLNGVFSFCAGEDIELPRDEYTFVRLHG